MGNMPVPNAADPVGMWRNLMQHNTLHPTEQCSRSAAWMVTVFEKELVNLCPLTSRPDGHVLAQNRPAVTPKRYELG